MDWQFLAAQNGQNLPQFRVNAFVPALGSFYCLSKMRSETPAQAVNLNLHVGFREVEIVGHASIGLFTLAQDEGLEGVEDACAALGRTFLLQSTQRLIQERLCPGAFAKRFWIPPIDRFVSPAELGIEAVERNQGPAATPFLRPGTVTLVGKETFDQCEKERAEPPFLFSGRT